jgi:hypothetical protein
MPKSGRAEQYCPCGSDRRPHVAISFAARSLHIPEREKTAETTIYICPLCVEKFDQALNRQVIFSRSLHMRTRDRILSAVGYSVLSLWAVIADKVPQ